MKKLLNLEYSLVQGTYWMYYGIACSFASVFLLDKDYSNSQIGAIFAFGSVLSVLIQPALANFTDHSKKFSLINVIEGLVIAMLILNTGLLLLNKQSLVLTIVYVFVIALITSGQPFINSLNFYLQRADCHINFGVARSMGSLLYSLMMAALGSIVLHYGVMSIPVSGQIVLTLMLVFIVATHIRFRKEKDKLLVIEEQEEHIKPIALDEFINRNKYFFIMSFGIIGLYFGNAVLNIFMMQIVDNVNGNSADMGRILSLMAALEIPTMVLFEKIHKKFTYTTLIIVASFGFTIKVALCYLATSVFLIFIAQFTQLFAFALFLPAMVHFIDDVMDKREAVRGQALFIVMTTIGSVLSSIFGGMILDVGGATTLLLVATIFSIIGTLIITIYINKITAN
ncbi:MAG: MFS transporter [Peptostreptococcaceae bacterium]|nr:MFS transporter [Peptostreptococcaceae bacterium]